MNYFEVLEVGGLFVFALVVGSRWVLLRSCIVVNQVYMCHFKR